MIIDLHMQESNSSQGPLKPGLDLHQDYANLLPIEDGLLLSLPDADDVYGSGDSVHGISHHNLTGNGDQAHAFELPQDMQGPSESGHSALIDVPFNLCVNCGSQKGTFDSSCTCPDAMCASPELSASGDRSRPPTPPTVPRGSKLERCDGAIDEAMDTTVDVTALNCAESFGDSPALCLDNFMNHPLFCRCAEDAHHVRAHGGHNPDDFFSLHGTMVCKEDLVPPLVDRNAKVFMPFGEGPCDVCDSQENSGEQEEEEEQDIEEESDDWVEETPEERHARQLERKREQRRRYFACEMLGSVPVFQDWIDAVANRINDKDLAHEEGAVDVDFSVCNLITKVSQLFPEGIFPYPDTEKREKLQKIATFSTLSNKHLRGLLKAHNKNLQSVKTIPDTASELVRVICKEAQLRSESLVVTEAMYSALTLMVVGCFSVWHEGAAALLKHEISPRKRGLYAVRLNSRIFISMMVIECYDISARACVEANPTVMPVPVTQVDVMLSMQTSTLFSNMGFMRYVPNIVERFATNNCKTPEEKQQKLLESRAPCNPSFVAGTRDHLTQLLLWRTPFLEEEEAKTISVNIVAQTLAYLIFSTSAIATVPMPIPFVPTAAILKEEENNLRTAMNIIGRPIPEDENAFPMHQKIMAHKQRVKQDTAPETLPSGIFSGRMEVPGPTMSHLSFGTVAIDSFHEVTKSTCASLVEAFMHCKIMDGNPRDFYSKIDLIHFSLLVRVCTSFCAMLGVDHKAKANNPCVNLFPVVLRVLSENMRTAEHVLSGDKHNRVVSAPANNQEVSSDPVVKLLSAPRVEVSDNLGPSKAERAKQQKLEEQGATLRGVVKNLMKGSQARIRIYKRKQAGFANIQNPHVPRFVRRSSWAAKRRFNYPDHDNTEPAVDATFNKLCAAAREAGVIQ